MKCLHSQRIYVYAALSMCVSVLQCDLVPELGAFGTPAVSRVQCMSQGELSHLTESD